MVPKHLRAMDYQGVELLDSRLSQQVKQTIEFYLQLPNDELLYGFRKRAGMKPKGKGLAGWYGDDIFNAFGQYLGGLARLYAVSRDARIPVKLQQLVSGWTQTIESDGFFFYSEKIPKATHYFYEKLCGGLLDCYLYAGIEQALSSLSVITDWASAHLDRSNPYAKNALHSPTEWYTLSENLYRAYTATGDNKYKELGDAFLYNEFYEYFYRRDFDGLMDKRLDSTSRRYHAYSHINSLNGAAMAYEVKADPYYLQVIQNAYEMLKETQLLNSGGFGPNETLLQRNQRSEIVFSESDTFETPCGSWAAFKLCRYLTEFTGNAVYGDWVERLIYNGIGAALPLNEQTGEVMYFSNFLYWGAAKKNIHPYSCCTGTYPQAVADYANQIYYVGEDELMISQYISSKANLTIGQHKVIAEVECRFPESNTVRIRIKSKHDSLKLRLRRPEWAESFRLSFSGQYTECSESHTVLLTGNFTDAEIIVQWQCGLRIEAIEPADSFSPFCFMYGPVLLCVKAAHRPVLTPDDVQAMLALTPTKNRWEYQTVLHGQELIIKPFRDFEENERYFTYFDFDNSLIYPENIRFYPEPATEWWDLWGSESARKSYLNPSDDLSEADAPTEEEAKTTFMVSKGYRSAFEADFEGVGVRWILRMPAEGSLANVYIDGQLVRQVETQGGEYYPLMYQFDGLPDGKHTIRVEADNEGNHERFGKSFWLGTTLCVRYLRPLK